MLKVFLTSALDGGEQSALCSGHYTYRNRTMAEPHSLSEPFIKLQSFFPLRGIEPPFLCHPARILLSRHIQGGPAGIAQPI
jgi:hypothetical protein